MKQKQLDEIKERVKLNWAYSEHLNLCKQDVSDLLAEVEQLMEYVNHRPTCPFPIKECDCGLRELIFSSTEQKREK